MGMIKEFREFALKGNMVDMAVGIIIGGAFGTMVTSFVTDIAKPPIDYLVAKGQQANPIGLRQQIGETMTDADGKAVQFVMDWGKFVNAIVSFLIVALVVFFIVKALNTAKRKFEKEKAAEVPAVPPDVKLLTEIRDLLAKR
ncbi:MAG: large conductance mechanosensitive channel protein MscL [Phycisphaerales bacterium]|jgi:large conductance mechanosensitive channel